MKTIYRMLATVGGLGYGFPEESFREAMKQKLDLIAADSGSIDPGPYYLGMGVSYQGRPNLKRDFSIMLAGALEQGCPVIIGSCGLAGDTPNLMFMVDIAKEVFRELCVRDLKVAVIDGHIDHDILIGHVDCLVPLGRMGMPVRKDIVACKLVGQMGIAPFIKALEEGAQVILAGRACDIAIYAADPVRRGIDPGLAFHAGHVLECGGMACDPGSGSDCLVAEFRDDESVIFTPPNKTFKATTYSVAAHSLYEEDHPTVHFYPEGVLSLEKTEYFETGERSTGIRKSEFFTKPLTVKVEGSRKTGERYISVLGAETSRISRHPTLSMEEMAWNPFLLGTMSVRWDFSSERRARSRRRQRPCSRCGKVSSCTSAIRAVVPRRATSPFPFRHPK